MTITSLLALLAFIFAVLAEVIGNSRLTTIAVILICIVLLMGRM
jgi:hypothetical protein